MIDQKIHEDGHTRDARDTLLVHELGLEYLNENEICTIEHERTKTNIRRREIVLLDRKWNCGGDGKVAALVFI
jgi:hypothetical protein